MTTTKDSERSEAQAKAQMENIAELVRALQEGGDAAKEQIRAPRLVHTLDAISTGSGRNTFRVCQMLLFRVLIGPRVQGGMNLESSG